MYILKNATKLFISKVLIISNNLSGILNFCCRVNREYVSSLNHKLYNLKCPVLVVLKLCKNNYFTNTLVMSTKSRKVSLNHKLYNLKFAVLVVLKPYKNNYIPYNLTFKIIDYWYTDGSFIYLIVMIQYNTIYVHHHLKQTQVPLWPFVSGGLAMPQWPEIL